MGAGSADGAQYFRDLYELASADLDPGEKIARAVEVGRDRLGLDNGVLSYTGAGEYEVVETNVTTGQYTAGSVSPLGETWCRHVVDRGEPVAFADADRSEYSDDVAREATGLRCYVGAPVRVDGETYGTLCYSDESPRDAEFTEDERQFVALLADWIGHELEREKHYRELRAQNDRLDEFAGIVAHDLRNPLAGALGFTELALERTEGEVHGYLERVTDSLHRMESLIDECLVLAKEGADIGQREPVDLAATARVAWSTVRTGDATLEVDPDAEKTVTADGARLQRVFENLFRNAVEHCQPGVSVTVDGRPDGFAVSDDGPGLPDAVVEALDAADEDNIGQLGLGLLIVSRVVSAHGWTLSVDTAADGTTFEIDGMNRATPAHRERTGA